MQIVARKVGVKTLLCTPSRKLCIPETVPLNGPLYLDMRSSPPRCGMTWICCTRSWPGSNIRSRTMSDDPSATAGLTALAQRKGDIQRGGTGRSWRTLSCDGPALLHRFGPMSCGRGEDRGPGGWQVACDRQP